MAKHPFPHWLAQAFSLLGHKAALLGTVGNGFIGQLTAATHTTPDPVTVQHKLAEYRAEGAQVVAMEVSSHGLDQFRVNGVAFATAVFTNPPATIWTTTAIWPPTAPANAPVSLAGPAPRGDQCGRSLRLRAGRQPGGSGVQVFSYGLDGGDITVSQLEALAGRAAAERAHAMGRGPD